MNGFKADSSKSAWANFKDFIALQEGGLSRDPFDSASSRVPPKPHTDGHFYHTNRGWTWNTWQNTRKRFNLSATSEQFYTMDRADSDKLKDKVFFADYQFSDSEVINVFCFYVSWGGGWYGGRFANAYKKLTKRDLFEDLKKQEPELLFDNLIKARVQDLSNISMPGTKNNRYRNTWIGAIAIFNREFSQFVKKK